jgi:curved DNA-binding protein CbpA
MGNQNGKPHPYQQYYDTMRGGGGAGVAGVAGVAARPGGSGSGGPSLNPYEILGVGRDFTWEELKAQYRRMAALVHPDKGGSELLFQTVSDAFRTLAKEYQARQADVGHMERKAAIQKYQKEQGGGSYSQSVAPDSGESFQERFNRVFEENRIEDEDQRGYGHQMAASSKTREDIEIPTLFKKFNKDAFHNAFENLPPPKSQVVKYQEPEAMVLTKNIAFTELGGKANDFTHQDPTAKSGLFYTDYMEAYNEHNQRLIDPASVKRKEFRNVEQYDAYRTKKSARPITEREQAALDAQKADAERREQERLERLTRQDEMYRLVNERTQRLMLGSRRD